MFFFLAHRAIIYVREHRKAGIIMQAETRRQKIIDVLRSSRGPVSAGKLAETFGVSRQIIVGDIALLRAAGTDITATPRGYVLTRIGAGIVHKIPCRHKPEEMKQELEIMVDNGCIVRDVIVEHPIYGQIVGQLDILTRHDVNEFVERVSQSDAAPLSDLTGGIHLHTIIAPSKSAYLRVLGKLREKGFLLEE